MNDHQGSKGLSLKIMMLVLLLLMAVAAGIAYLLVYPFFHRQHISRAGSAQRGAIYQRMAMSERITRAE